MSIIDTILSVIVPHDCVGCGPEESLLCQVCQMAIGVVPERCYRCHRLTKKWPDLLPLPPRQ